MVKLDSYAYDIHIANLHSLTHVHLKLDEAVLPGISSNFHVDCSCILAKENLHLSTNLSHQSFISPLLPANPLDGQYDTYHA